MHAEWWLSFSRHYHHLYYSCLPIFVFIKSYFLFKLLFLPFPLCRCSNSFLFLFFLHLFILLITVSVIVIVVFLFLFIRLFIISAISYIFSVFSFLSLILPLLYLLVFISFWCVSPISHLRPLILNRELEHASRKGTTHTIKKSMNYCTGDLESLLLTFLGKTILWRQLKAFERRCIYVVFYHLYIMSSSFNVEEKTIS